MSKQRKLQVGDSEIRVIHNMDEDFISLTDMVHNYAEGNTLIENWMRNKNTIEFLGMWERLNNQDFNSVEFDGIMKQAGLNRFKLSVKQWVEKTGSIGVVSKAGKYGGTFAHKDIAFEFGMWLSPEFKLLLIKEFQRLKDYEAKLVNEQWDYRRFLTKVNYKVHTDSVKQNLLPILNVPKDLEWLVYAEEADIMNFALFGLTAKQWREKYPERVAQGRNIRDFADLHQLTVLANLESYNSILMSENVDRKERFLRLRKTAVSQLKSMQEITDVYKIGSIESPFSVQERYEIESKKSEFDKTLGAIMKVPKPEK